MPKGELTKNWNTLGNFLFLHPVGTDPAQDDTHMTPGASWAPVSLDWGLPLPHGAHILCPSPWPDLSWHLLFLLLLHSPILLPDSWSVNIFQIPAQVCNHCFVWVLLIHTCPETLSYSHQGHGLRPQNHMTPISGSCAKLSFQSLSYLICKMGLIIAPNIYLWRKLNRIWHIMYLVQCLTTD